MNDLALEMRRWSEKINALPPAPRGIRAHHSVPWGRVFRQWDTRGNLWLWANAQMIADLPRPKPKPDVLDPLGSTFGIPVYSGAEH